MLSNALKWVSSSISKIGRSNAYSSPIASTYSLNQVFSKGNSCWHMLVRGMANHRHKKVIKLAKGFRGRANRCYSVAYHRVIKARQYAYRDRKVKKREFRSLWIQRINAASRMYGMPYSNLVWGMQQCHIGLNRKVLSDLAITEPLSFKSVIEVVKSVKK